MQRSGCPNHQHPTLPLHKKTVREYEPAVQSHHTKQQYCSAVRIANYCCAEKPPREPLHLRTAMGLTTAQTTCPNEQHTMLRRDRITDRSLHPSRAISAYTQDRAKGSLMLVLGSAGCSPGAIPAEHAWNAESNRRQCMMRTCILVSQGTVGLGPKCLTHIVDSASNVTNRRASWYSLWRTAHGPHLQIAQFRGSTATT